MYESTDNVGWVRRYSGSNTSFTLNNKGDATYYFVARACNDAGCSDYNPSSTVTVRKRPETPVIAGPTSSNSGRFTLSFPIPQLSPVYIVERARNGSVYEEIEPGSSSPLFPESLKEDGLYGYRVKAINMYGESEWSATHVVDVRLTPQGVIDDSPIVTLPYPSANDNVGAIEGMAEVSGGAATYRMKLQVPPGRRGLSPDVALVYSSRQTTGIAGAGWSLSVGSRIHRCQQTPATDDDPVGPGVSARFRGIDYTAYDRLCLDGQRLVLMSGGYGTSWPDESTYRKEIDDRTRIRLVSGSIVTSHAEFEVEDADGNVFTYGGTAGNDNAIFHPTGAGSPDAWALRRREDPQTNFIEYTYSTQNQQHLLQEIRYTGHEATAGDRRVTLTYQSQPNQRFEYRAGARIASEVHRLREVTTYAPDATGSNTETMVRRYQLSYDLSPTTGRSLLTKVRDCAQNASCSASGAGVPDTVFEYQEGALSFSRRFVRPWDTSEHHLDQFRLAGDLDGDGSRDSIRARFHYSPGINSFTAFLTGSPGGTAIPFSVLFDSGSGRSTTWDLDSDGRSDLIGAASGYVAIGSYNADQGAFEVLTTDVPDTFGLRQVGDFDGNGAIDLLGYEAGKWWIYLQRDDGAALRFIGPIEVPDFNGNYTVTSVADYDGDGLADLLLGRGTDAGVPPDAKIWFSMRESGPSGPRVTFFKQSLPNDLGGPDGISTPSEPIMFIDLNGDGLLDIYGNESDIRINTGGSFTAGTGIINAHHLNIPEHFRSHVLTGDFDGDGADEVLVPTTVVVGFCLVFQEGEAEPIDYCSTAYQGHERFQDTPSRWSQDRGIYAWDLIDFHQDSAGNLVVDRQSTDLEAPFFAGSVQDHFGDGLDDVEFHVLPLTGLNQNGPIKNYYYYDVSGSKPADGQYIARADGLKPDLMTKATDGLGVEARFAYRPLSSWGGSSPSGLTDGDCLQGDLLTPFYHADLLTPHPRGHHYFASNMHVVSKLETSDGNGGFRPKCFKYRDAMFNREGRGFLGFRQIIEEEAFTVSGGGLDPNNLRTTTTFLQLFPTIDRVVSTAVNLVSDAETAAGFQQTTTDWNDDWIKNCVDGLESNRARSCFVYKDSEIADVYDLNNRSNQISQVHTIDIYTAEDLGYRNLTQRQVATSDEFTDHLLIEAYEYNYNDAGQGWTNRVSKKTTTTQVMSYEPAGLVPDAALNDAKVVIVDYDWYPLTASSRRLMKWSDTQASPPKAADQRRRVDFLYDVYGNVTQKDETGAHMSPRQTTYAYTSDGYFEEKMTNAEDHVFRQTWDPPLGKPLTATDPNGLVTTFVYDRARNVQKRVERPGERPRRMRLQWCGSGVSCPAGTIYRTVEVQAGHPILRRYHDRLGRVRKVASTGFDGVQEITVVTDFDHRGYKTRESQPSFESDGAHFTTYSDYDALGRVGRKVVDRTGENATFPTFETTYTYDGLRTDITIQGLLHASRTYDAQQRLMETVDTMGGRTRFAYDGLGNVVTIEDAADSITKAYYDDLGQRRWIEDPNQGRTEFTYNAAGDVVTKIDANQLANDEMGVKTTYDDLGRPLERKVNGVVKAEWTYDPAGALGQPATASVPGGLSRTFTYDALARVVRMSEQVSSVSMVTQYGYDTQTGRQKGVRTPSGRFVATHVTEHGYPLRTFDPLDADSGHYYRSVLDVDARGNVVEALLGNGLRQHRRFYASTGQLSQVCVTPAATPCHPTTPSDQEIQRIDYRYEDPYGNLTTEYDDVHDAQESFLYDDLLRVKASSRSWPGESPVVVNYDYDAVGNILQKDDYADPTLAAPYVYGNMSRSVRSAGPNAVVLVTKPGGLVVEFEYDDNGNQIVGDDRTVEYTYFNKPSKITRGTVDTEFSYGPDDQRYLQVESPRTKLYSANYERLFYTGNPTQTHRDFISDFVVVETVDGTPTVRYIHRDRLGSVDTITTAAGSIFEEHSFGPFGAPRDGAKHDNGALLSSVVTDRGFTDHEHLDSHQLIHMNGRVYDPLLGRFLSVDPIIQAPNSNGLNPYSYVMNNPLMGTDPTGYWLETVTDLVSLGMSVAAVASWDKNTSTFTKILDIGSVVVDAAAVVLPGVPGVAGYARGGARVADAVDTGVDGARLASGAGDTASDVARAAGDDLAEAASRSSGGGAKTTANTSGKSADELGGGAGGGNKGSGGGGSGGGGSGRDAEADFAKRFEEKYPGRSYQTGHSRTTSDGKKIEIDFETDNAIVEIKAGKGKGLTGQIKSRREFGKVCIGIACSSKGLAPHVRKSVERAGGLAGGKTDIEDILDVIAPD